MDKIAESIHRTDSEDDLAEVLADAKMNAINTGPADDLGKYRRAEVVAFLLTPLKSNMRKIQFGSEIAVQVIHTPPHLRPL